MSSTSIPDIRDLAARVTQRRAPVRPTEARVFAGPDGRRYSTRSSNPRVRKVAKRTALRYDQQYGEQR